MYNPRSPVYSNRLGRCLGLVCSEPVRIFIQTQVPSVVRSHCFQDLGTYVWERFAAPPPAHGVTYTVCSFCVASFTPPVLLTSNPKTPN
jgi:hypothetical protein